MNCDAIVSRGHQAWLPHSKARDLDAIHVHDIPLIGTFELASRRVLFACLTGATSNTSVWGYVPISDDQVAELNTQDFGSTESLEVWVHSCFVGRRAAFATVKGATVSHWSSDDVGEDGVLSAAIRFMDLEMARLSEGEDTKRAQHRRAEQARVDATRQVLEPA